MSKLTRLGLGGWLILGAFFAHVTGATVLAALIALTAIITLGTLLLEVL